MDILDILTLAPPFTFGDVQVVHLDQLGGTVIICGAFAGAARVRPLLGGSIATLGAMSGDAQ